MAAALPDSPYPRPRGLVPQGGLWGDVGGAPSPSGGGGRFGAGARPSPVRLPPDDFDSLDALLGGGAGGLGPSPTPQQRCVWAAPCHHMAVAPAASREHTDSFRQLRDAHIPLLLHHLQLTALCCGSRSGQRHTEASHARQTVCRYAGGRHSREGNGCSPNGGALSFTLAPSTPPSPSKLSLLWLNMQMTTRCRCLPTS